MKTVIAFLIFGVLQLAAQDMQSCPMHKEHMKEAAQHQADVEKHGDEAMGFPHDKTTSSFPSVLRWWRNRSDRERQ